MVMFGLLGDVHVRLDDASPSLGHARQRCVLVALLMEPNRPQPADVLIERVWGEQPPKEARATLYGYLYRLRHALADVPGVSIDRTSGGYVLAVDENTVDVHRFRDLVRQSRSEDDEEAIALLEQALGLWRGQAFSGLEGPWIAALRHTLEQERWMALLRRNDIALRLGRHRALLAELSAIAEENPLDEHLAGQLILTLSRCGRQADALEAYRKVQRRLADELGVDPGPALREVYQQILAGEAMVPAEPVAGRRRPRQLPARPRLFVGRIDELARMDKALVSDTGETPVLAIVGAAGTGKTTLALRWAHRAIDQFPDGQLHADLRGFDPIGSPVSPGAVVRGFLDALGVPAESVPADEDVQLALYRSLVAGKRMLVVLDNARDTDHVLPLLPGSHTCTVLITSRHRLTGLAAGHGVPTLALDVLSTADAEDLLADHLAPQWVQREPEAVADLLAWCAGLPLAIGIVAARAAIHPDFPLSALADELREADGLGALDTGEVRSSLRAVFTASYRALSPAAAEAFALLGVAPGPDIGARAAAALLAMPLPRLRELLQHLETGHLVHQHAPGRYRMHDLVRVYAMERARADHADAGEAALRRLIDFYAGFGCAAEKALYPYEEPAGLGDPAQPVPGFADDTAAMAWLTAEYPCLVAAQDSATQHGWHAPVWQLAWALDTFQRRRGYTRDHLARWRAGLAAAERSGAAGPRALTAWRLGAALARTGNLSEAAEHLDRALALSRDSNDRPGEANAHQALAWVCEQQGDDASALHHATSALSILRAAGPPMREAHALNQAGWYAAKLGDLEQARHHCEAALELTRRHQDEDAEARTLDSLGYIAQSAGDPSLAIDYYEQALVRFDHSGASYDYADTVARLGDSHAAVGHTGQAETAWRKAVSLLVDQHRHAEADLLHQRMTDAGIVPK